MLNSLQYLHIAIQNVQVGQYTIFQNYPKIPYLTSNPKNQPQILTLLQIFLLGFIAVARGSIYGLGAATLVGPSASAKIVGPDGGAILAAPHAAGIVSAAINPGYVGLSGPIIAPYAAAPLAVVPAGLGKYGGGAVLSGPSGVVSAGAGGAVLSGPSATVVGGAKLWY